MQSDDLPGDRLDEMLIRYWDHQLSEADLRSLEAMLLSDPSALPRLESFCLQALVPSCEPVLTPQKAQRSVLKAWVLATFLGCVTLATLLVAVRLPFTAQNQVRILNSTGAVQVQIHNQVHQAIKGEWIQGGGTISTMGVDASAMLLYPDGTEVVLTGDTIAKVLTALPGGQLHLIRGAISADVSSRKDQQPFTLATAEASAFALNSAKVSVNRNADQTEFGVMQGSVQVTGPAGNMITDMSEGETATIEDEGRVVRMGKTLAPTSFAWDLSQPLPSRWGLGKWLFDLQDPGLNRIVPERWHDVYIHRHCWQIRSENRWPHGFCTLNPNSRVKIQYRLERPGELQILMVVRNDRYPKSLANVLLAPTHKVTPGDWITLDTRFSQWRLETKPNRPPFDPNDPGVATLMVFNTYEQDLGLSVREFRIDGP